MARFFYIAAGALPSSSGSHRPLFLTTQSRSFAQATEAIRKLIKQGNVSEKGDQLKLTNSQLSHPLNLHAAASASAGGAGAPITQGLDAASASFSHHPHVTLSPGRIRLAKALQIILPISGISLLLYAFTHPDSEPLIPQRMPPELQYLAAQQIENKDVVVNWSNTHSAKPKRFFLPESEAEVEAFIRAAHDSGQKLRVVGSALSPNGLALSDREGMIGMSLLDKIISIDVDKRRVTVQAGARVQQVADALKPHGLTLQNYASIRDQQVGGFTQVGAHGTGASIPPVDQQVVSMRLATPAMGTVTLSREDEPELFNLAKVGLGALGVVTRVELQCIPRHQLLEETTTCTVSEVNKNHVKWLRENQHLKYLWLPYTDSVVVVKCNPVKPSDKPSDNLPSFTDEQRVEPLRQLYFQRMGSSLSPPSKAEINAIASAPELRDRLLSLDPLDKDWVAKVNRAEAEYWKRAQGTRVGYSDEILGFDCGGQQCVLETCFPVAESLDKIPEGGRSKDLDYIRTLLKEIEKSKIPAPSPIEQRWTSGSSSALSPSVGSPSSVHCWVGTIMYLPSESSAVVEGGGAADGGGVSKRQQVVEAFKSYSEVVQERVMPKYNAAWHWAKLEVPRSAQGQVDEGKMDRIRKKLGAKYPLDLFNAYRSMLDPKNILANEWLDQVIPRR